MDVIADICVATRWTTKAKMTFPSDRYGDIYSWSYQMERFRGLRSMGIEFYLSAR